MFYFLFAVLLNTLNGLRRKWKMNDEAYSYKCAFLCDCCRVHQESIVCSCDRLERVSGLGYRSSNAYAGASRVS